jgi:hypothetical protein
VNLATSSASRFAVKAGPPADAATRWASALVCSIAAEPLGGCGCPTSDIGRGCRDRLHLRRHIQDGIGDRGEGIASAIADRFDDPPVAVP